MKIAWIGTGIMGAPMVSALMDNDYKISLYNRTALKAEALQLKAKVCYSIQEVVKDADIIFSIVSLPSDVRQVYLENGILAHAKEGAICVDMTTSSPSLAQEIAHEASKKNILCLDAPVSGGDVGARNHSLTIMAGGSKTAYKIVLPLFNLMGKTINHVGEAGTGQHMKLANQIAVANNLLGAIESLSYAKQVGLLLEDTITVLSGGAGASWQLAVNGKLMINEDYRPGFMNVHFIKDLKLVVEEAKKVNLSLPMVEKILGMYLSHSEESFLNESSVALYKDYITS
jgi:3-hydroxyisobutyrate dehydrogenase